MLRDVVWGTLDVLGSTCRGYWRRATDARAESQTLKPARSSSRRRRTSPDDARGDGEFKKGNVPVLGIVETMSFFPVPELRHADTYFRPWRGAARAKNYGVPFLGEDAAAHVDSRHLGRRHGGRSTASPTDDTPRSTRYRPQSPRATSGVTLRLSGQPTGKRRMRLWVVRAVMPCRVSEDDTQCYAAPRAPRSRGSSVPRRRLNQGNAPQGDA